MDTGNQSQKIVEFNFKLRVEKIRRAKLQNENQLIHNIIQAMEQSLKEHKDYIVEL